MRWTDTDRSASEWVTAEGHLRDRQERDGSGVRDDPIAALDLMIRLARMCAEMKWERSCDPKLSVTAVPEIQGRTCDT